MGERAADQRRAGLPYLACPVHPMWPGNERTVVFMPAALPATGQLDVAVTRVAPLLGNMPVMSGGASSAVHFQGGIEIGRILRPPGRWQAALVQGVLVRLPYSASIREHHEITLTIALAWGTGWPVGNPFPGG